MIEVAIIGINHFDPLGRDKIGHILNNELVDFAPDSIAVEWKQEIANEVVRQRTKMREVMIQEYSCFEPDVIEHIVNAMAFESDSHISKYPNLPIIWLDQEREETIDDDSVINFHIYRKGYYDSMIRSGIVNIADLSNMICKSTSIRKPGKRDNMFYEKLRKDCLENGYNKIICVVGASHANINEKGSFADLLIKERIKVTTFDTTNER